MCLVAPSRHFFLSIAHTNCVRKNFCWLKVASGAIAEEGMNKSNEHQDESLPSTLSPVRILAKDITSRSFLSGGLPHKKQQPSLSSSPLQTFTLKEGCSNRVWDSKLSTASVTTVCKKDTDGTRPKQQPNTLGTLCAGTSLQCKQKCVSTTTNHACATPTVSRDPAKLLLSIVSTGDANSGKDCDRPNNEMIENDHYRHRHQATQSSCLRNHQCHIDVNTAMMISNTTPTKLVPALILSPSQPERRLERAVEALSPYALLSPQKQSTQCRTRSLAAQQTVLAMLSM